MQPQYRKFQGSNTRHPHNRSAPSSRTPAGYELLETRQVLAAIFPTYIDGQFTFGIGGTSSNPYPLTDTFKLESNPTATKIIYLDFDGHHSVNNAWNHDIMFPAFDRDGNTAAFSTAELIEIQLQFQNVAEDFLPFNVNVITKEPSLDRLIKSNASDQLYGVRAVNTQATGGFGNGIGGVAYLNSFDDNIDNPVFTFNKGENNGAMTNSHEVGHALGLSHDGLGTATYHGGTGTGETSWGPIMGAPFGKTVTQWSNGDYTSSTNTQDDYSIITKTANGFGFRTDSAGDTIATASALSPDINGNVFAWNIIERLTDVDMFTFETGGAVSLSLNAFQLRPNLDVWARVYNELGALVATNNPVDETDATLNLNLAPGRYYLSIDGVGKTGVYSEYGSIGFYTISGTIQPLPGVPAGEVGRISIDHNWTTVNLNRTYQNPVVVANVITTTNSQPLNVRVRNVTSTSFQVHLDEWNYLDGTHPTETISYMVVEAGEHVLTDGTRIVAGNQTGQDYRWSRYKLGDSFGANNRPIVLTQIVTENDVNSASTRVRFLNNQEFDVRIQEQELSKQRHGAETVGFIAFEVGTGITGSSTFEAFVTGNSVTDQNFNQSFTTTFDAAPALFAEMQSHNSGDTAVVRGRSVAANGAVVFIEEEQSQDAEVNHGPEIVGGLAIDVGLFRIQSSQKMGSTKGLGADKFFLSATEDYSEALKLLRSWGETTLPLGDQHGLGHDKDADTCCCGNCVGDLVATIAQLDAKMFGHDPQLIKRVTLNTRWENTPANSPLTNDENRTLAGEDELVRDDWMQVATKLMASIGIETDEPDQSIDTVDRGLSEMELKSKLL